MMSAVRKRLHLICKSIIPATIEGRLRLGSIILIVLLSLLFIVRFAVYELDDEREKAFSHLEQGITLRRQMITLWAQNEGGKIKTLAGTESVRKVNKKAMAADFEAALAADNKFCNIFFVNKEGRSEVDLKKAPGIDLSQKDFLKRAQSGQLTTAELTRLEASGKTRLVFAAPVYSPDEQFEGAVVGIMPLSAIDAILGSLGFGKTGDIYLVNQGGIRFTVPRFASEAGMVPEETACYLKTVENIAVRKSLAGESGIQIYDNCRGILVLGSYQPISELGWGIVGEIEEQEVLSPVYAEIAKMLVLFLVIILAVLPLTVIMAEPVKKPLAALLSGSERIKNLDFTFRVDNIGITQAPCEVRELCMTFNQMAKKINEQRDNLENKISKRTLNLENALKKLRRQVRARRKAEFQLLRSEEKYRALFDKATDVIFVTEINSDTTPGRFIEVNNKACELFGYTKQEFLELTPFDIIDASLKAGQSPINWNVANYQNMLVDTNCIKKSGEVFPVEMNVHSISLNGEIVYFTILRDVSLKRQIEQELARMDRLNMVGEMAASIGHEVRNPMTTVRGFLQMLGRRSENSANADYFKLMIEELDRANGIITEFLSLAKNKTVDLKLGSLNQIIRTIYPLINADAIITAKEAVLELDESIPELYLDEKEIRQLVLNLVRNGLEAAPPQTKLTLKTYSEKNEVVLAVKDAGPGIPPEVLDKLGTPFFTTKEKGTGLGLAVCYSIANRHNAVIVPETGPNGTTFYIKFKVT